MENTMFHFHHHFKDHTRRVTHHNSRDILSILFDEVNLREEKFAEIKKELNSKHHYKLMMYKESSLDVFNQFT